MLAHRWAMSRTAYTLLNISVPSTLRYYEVPKNETSRKRRGQYI
jgi:hypothetical protein